jgi:hypothetical protein
MKRLRAHFVKYLIKMFFFLNFFIYIYIYIYIFFFTLANVFIFIFIYTFEQILYSIIYFLLNIISHFYLLYSCRRLYFQTFIFYN